MSPTTQGLLAELDTMLPRATTGWRGNASRRIVDLFCLRREILNRRASRPFRDVIGRLTPNTD